MKKNLKNIALIILLTILVLALTGCGNSEKTIQYSEYEYLKDKINDYNGVYSKNTGYYSSSVLLVEDPTNIILMITLPRSSDGGKDVALVDFTNMKAQNTSYNKNGSEIIVCKMNIDKDFNISSAETYDYTVNRERTYTSNDEEWEQIQAIAIGVGNGINAIIEGNDGKTIDIYGKTIKMLKNTEYMQ